MRTAWTPLDVYEDQKQKSTKIERQKEIVILSLLLSLSLSRGGKRDQKRPFTTNPLLKRIIPLMKGKKLEREPEYIHWPDSVCVWVSKAHSSCVCMCFYMCVWARAMNVPCEGVWKRPDARCQALLCLSSPSSPPGPDDGWRRMRSFLSWTADCSRLPSEDRPSAFHCRGRQGPLVLGLGFGCTGSTMGLQRQPGLEAGWAAEEWTILWNWEMKHRKLCLFSTELGSWLISLDQCSSGSSFNWDYFQHWHLYFQLSLKWQTSKILSSLKSRIWGKLPFHVIIIQLELTSLKCAIWLMCCSLQNQSCRWLEGAF